MTYFSTPTEWAKTSLVCLPCAVLSVDPNTAEVTPRTLGACLHCGQERTARFVAVGS